jgi:hypothetical protein
MAQILVHMEDCIRILREPFKEVHQWLDYYARIFTIRPYLAYHRFFRHNKRGMIYIKNRWGVLAEDACKVHLIRDYEDFILTTAMSNVKYYQINKLCNKVLMICNDGELTEPMIPQQVAIEMNEFNIGLIALSHRK